MPLLAPRTLRVSLGRVLPERRRLTLGSAKLVSKRLDLAAQGFDLPTEHATVETFLLASHMYLIGRDRVAA